MADDIIDASEIDPEDIIDVEYDDIPEEHCKQFEAQLRMEQEEAMRRLLACYERTRQGVIKKEEFIMPTFPSTATSEVSTMSPDLVEQFMSIIGDRIVDSCDRTNDLLRNLVDQVRGLGEGEVLDHSYSTETLNPSSSAASAFTSQPLYSMPLNYFAGQSPSPHSALPNMAELVKPVLLTGQTGVTVASPATPAPFASIPCSAGPS